MIIPDNLHLDEVKSRIKEETTVSTSVAGRLCKLKWSLIYFEYHLSFPQSSN